MNYFSIGEAKSQVYLGTGAGKRLHESIENAKDEIIILSPFLSPSLIDILVYKASHGVKVTLITNDMNKKGRDDLTGHENVVRKVLKQKRHTDDTAVKNRQKRKNISLIWFFINLILLAGAALFFMRIFPPKVYELIHIFASLVGIPMILTLLIAAVASFIANAAFYINAVNTRIYNYEYIPLINFVIFKNGYNGNRGDIHAKVYCIDNQTAYLGSLNYTVAGFNTHFETCVTVTDRASVTKISESLMQVYSGIGRKAYTIDELSWHYFRFSEYPF